MEGGISQEAQTIIIETHNFGFIALLVRKLSIEKPQTSKYKK